VTPSGAKPQNSHRQFGLTRQIGEIAELPREAIEVLARPLLDLLAQLLRS
jgi:hypothetical protein